MPWTDPDLLARGRELSESHAVSFRLANVDGRAALVVGNAFHDIEEISDGRLSSDPMEVVARADELSHLVGLVDGRPPSGSLADVTLDPPVPRPSQVFGIGLNYRNHASEGGMDLPDTPLVFTKFPSCISAPNSDIRLRSDFCDYEGELVAVIGTGGRDIAVADAWDHVAGLCVGQDVSDRAVQFTGPAAQFSLGKSFETFGPIGPDLLSPDALDDPSALSITTEVNGEVRQSDTTADLIFDVPTLVSYLSHITALRPGDVIFTGTPGGVGLALGKLLRDGDVVTTKIDGLGTLTNRCVRVDDHPNADNVPPMFQQRADAGRRSRDDDG
jgi:2-keto-4-pentenoate hydratase/2-oxohepta-3-ene-1,7-dioic acid hydratase in catechol pathway